MESLRTFTLSTLNTYLIPPSWTRYKTNPIARAKEISKFYNKHNPDIIMLQEVWGVGIPEINSKIKNTHLTFFDKRIKLPTNLLNTATNSAINFLSQTGGLYYAHKPILPLLWTNRETYKVSATRSQKGIRGHLFNMDNLLKKEKGNEDEPSKYLLIFNTHLDAFNDANKAVQLDQAKKFIQKTLNTTLPTLLEKENLQKTLKSQSISSGPLPEVAVAMVGDWNIPAHHKLYSSHLINLLGDGVLTDFYTKWYTPEKDKDHTYDSNNSLVTVHWAKGRIDYIFGLNSEKATTTSSSSSNSFNPSKKNYQLVSLDCQEYNIIRQKKGKEMTDHWPIIAKFSMAE